MRIITLAWKSAPPSFKRSLRKNFQIRSFSSPYFLPFRVNTEIYSVNLCIRSKYGKIQTRKKLRLDTYEEIKSLEVSLQNSYFKKMQYSFHHKILQTLRAILV